MARRRPPQPAPEEQVARDPARGSGSSVWIAAGLAISVLALAWWGADLLARRARGGTLPALGDLSALPAPAREQVDRADAEARAHPGSADAVGALARACHASLMPERAIDLYRLAEARAEATWIWTYSRGLLHEERGQQDEAVAAFTAVLARNPAHGLAWFRLGEMAFKQGRLDDAARAYQRAAQAPPSPPFLPQGVSARRVWPLAAYARFGLARVALERGDRSQALTVLDAILADTPDFGAARVLRRRIGSTAPSVAAPAASYVPPADPILDSIVAESRMRDLLLKHAAVAARGEDQGWREFLVRRALLYNPQDPNVLMEAASMLEAAGRAGEALEYLRQRQQLVPGDTLTLVEEGRALSEVGRYDEAETVLREAVRRRDAAAEYNLGALLDRTGRGDEARRHYERALEIDPFYFRAMNNLGVWYDRRGQSEAAVAMLRRAVEAAPDNAEAYSNLGSACLGARRLPEALAALEAAVALAPEAPEAHNNYGIALAQSGRLPEAAAQWQEAIRLDPTHVNARRNLEMLRRGR